jgi:precorrin-4 methylase
MTLMNREDIETWKRKLQIAHSGELSLEESVDLLHDTLRDDDMIFPF